MMKNLKKKLVSLMLAMAMIISGLQLAPAKAEAATALTKVPITCYPIATSNFRSYYSINGSAAGWIYPSDLCTIREVYSSGWVRVTYPTSRGTRTLYAESFNFFVNTDFSTNTVKSGVSRTVYKKSNLSSKHGCVYAGDDVVIIGSSSGNQQVLYSINGGYKMGFIKGAIATGSNPQGYVDTVKSTEPGRIFVEGWAFDRDALSNSLEVRAYVGYPYDSSKPYYKLTANKNRSDIERVYPGVGKYHGFSNVLLTSLTGAQTVYLYAMNQGGGENVLLGSKTVTIPGSSAASGTQIKLSVPDYKQYNSSWSSVKIGTKTIGQIGCLTCALADKYSFETGTATNPKQMKAKLSYSNNDLLWSSVTKLGYCYTGRYDTSITNNIMKTIYQKLKAGKPVVIGGRNSKGGQHWVVVTGYKGSSATTFSSGDFTINDPNSSSRATLNQFLNVYPKVVRLIY